MQGGYVVIGRVSVVFDFFFLLFVVSIIAHWPVLSWFVRVQVLVVVVILSLCAIFVLGKSNRYPPCFTPLMFCN